MPFCLHKDVECTHLFTVSSARVTWNGQTHHTQPQHHTAPKQNIIQQRSAFHILASLDHNDGHLQHHSKEAVATELSRNAAHHQLMRKRRDEKRDKRGQGPRQMVFGRRVDVAPEEVVHGDVPLAGELQPVAAVPPVGVELAVCEAWMEVSACVFIRL